jgi:hypothetical protein
MNEWFSCFLSTEMWGKYESEATGLEKKSADEVDRNKKLEFRISELEHEIERVKSIGDEEIEKAANRTKIVADMWENRCAHQTNEIQSLQERLASKWIHSLSLSLCVCEYLSVSVPYLMYIRVCSYFIQRSSKRKRRCHRETVFECGKGSNPQITETI